jgi:hypothetical protein
METNNKHKKQIGNKQSHDKKRRQRKITSDTQ